MKININIPLELENLENLENIVEIDAKQFADALKDVDLFQKLVEPEEFYRKVEKTSEVNNWSNK